MFAVIRCPDKSNPQKSLFQLRVLVKSIMTEVEAEGE